MKKRIFRYFKHIILTVVALSVIALSILLSEDGGIHYGDNPLKMDWDKDGPYVFYENDSTINVNYIRGNQADGFYVDQTQYSSDQSISGVCHFALDSSNFSFSISNTIESPPVIYNDDEKILAISDIESGYKTFRDFLIKNKVIDDQLKWTFGKGHLVLVGDFVDRGFSTTQVLWFIYKLEQEAKRVGGFVHFILGNHELKNLQGNYEAASPKYLYISAILEKQQYALYGPNSFIGRWLASKNTIERINGYLFVHGGLHPDVANSDLSLAEINEVVRGRYRHTFYPKKEKSAGQLLTSTNTGPSWFRGYFRDKLSAEEVALGLDKFEAKSVIVGHTIQNEVNKHFDGKVIGIDVQHPKDFHKNWPNRNSEGLLIYNDEYYRILANGEKEKI